MKLNQEYYNQILELLYNKYQSTWKNAQPGHCIKLTGLPEPQLLLLQKKVKELNPEMDCFVVDEEKADDVQYISATKLIELRNNENRALLALIPTNSRTAAEDSYGNATFQNIDLENIDSELLKHLLELFPTERQEQLNEITNFLRLDTRKSNKLLSYGLAIQQDNYSEESLGNNLFHLGYLPDRILFQDHQQTLARLNYNQISIELLADFSKPVYERVDQLPLERDSIQRNIIALFRDEVDLNSREKIVQKISQDYPGLNFEFWNIPTPNTTGVKVFVEWIKDGAGKSLEDQNGDKILKISESGSAKLKVRLKTSPPPNQVGDLVAFKISLMMADGQVLHSEITRFKNSATSLPYRDKTVEIFANSVDVGNYYLRIHALDNDGNILNTDDEFKDPKIQEAWEQENNEKENEADRSSFPYKLTCDSDTFHIEIGEDVDEPAEDRKAKLHNVLEAFFKFRIDKFKKSEEIEIPSPDEGESFWSESKQKKLLSTYYVKYNNRHHYQIICSRKLKLIEQQFLKEPRSLGYCKATISSNPASEEINRRLEETILTKFAPEYFLEKREKLFSIILNHCENGQGAFESFPWFEHLELLDAYLDAYNEWIKSLREKTQELTNLSSSQAEELNRLCQALTTFDMAYVQSKLPDGKELEVALLSPLHPLRLYWFRLLIQLFSEWENRTRSYEGHLKEWPSLEELFTGEWMPTNQPLIIPGLDSSYYIYSGELAFGWGLYSKSQQVETLNTRQVIAYFRRLFNVDRSAFVDNDVNKKIIIRHLSNFITQHPYVDKLVVNIFNGGEGYVFADALVELEKDPRFREINYEIRLFETKERVIPFGQGFKELINPEYNQSEQAESFSQATTNRMFPKLRYSVNTIPEFIGNFSSFSSHLSFLINPFTLSTTLIREGMKKNAQFVEGLITEPQVEVDLSGNEASWIHYLPLNPDSFLKNPVGKKAAEALKITQHFTANVLSKSSNSNSIPATKLLLTQHDNVMISKIHESSDWVVTLDRNLGPEIFDLPSKEGSKPFLLDYLPGEEIAGVSSFLTTHPTSEIIGMLGPHFEEFGIMPNTTEGKAKIKMLLEDLRAVSSSLILQLNSTKNKAFEVIGIALSKRVLEKKGILDNTIIVPIDLHQSLFPAKKGESQSRADQLIVNIDPDARSIHVTTLEIKCRNSLYLSQEMNLKEKIKDQVDNTTKIIQQLFDPGQAITNDRLDRSLKNYEFRSILSFYAQRARRFNYLTEAANEVYQSFLDTLDQGFQVKFRQLGFIFDFGSDTPHRKEILDSDFTCFTFGKTLIDEILDETSDLDTNRLEKKEVDELVKYFEDDKNLTPFLSQFREEIMIKTIVSDDHEINLIPSNLLIESEAELENEERPAEEFLVQQELGQASSQMLATAHVFQEPPLFDVFIGSNKPSAQYGILGQTQHGRKIAIDLNETVTISLFGVQGGGKSYSIGSVMEMVLKPVPNVNYLPAPMAGVIFHYSESMDYEPEFTSMKFPNSNKSELELLKLEYGAEPTNIDDVLLLTPKDKLKERKAQYPSIDVQPIAFNSSELDAKAWMFLLGALNNDSTYIRQLKSLMRQTRENLSIEGLRVSVEESPLLSNSQKTLALQRLAFAEDYIDDDYSLRDHLKPGRLIIVDLRDEYIMKDEALGLFVIMLNIFSSVTDFEGKRFNKFIVFDEAHKYMDNRDLAGKIVEAIREMRHKGVSIMIASQDPPSLPNEVIELSSIVITHKFNSPSWLKHIQKSITPLGMLSAADMSSLKTGEAFLWSSKSSDNGLTQRPSKIKIRPRVTKHGGGTLRAFE